MAEGSRSTCLRVVGRFLRRSAPSISANVRDRLRSTPPVRMQPRCPQAIQERPWRFARNRSVGQRKRRTTPSSPLRFPSLARTTAPIRTHTASWVTSPCRRQPSRRRARALASLPWWRSRGLAQRRPLRFPSRELRLAVGTDLITLNRRGATMKVGHENATQRMFQA